VLKKQKNSKEKLDLATDTKQCQVTREIDASATHSGELWGFPRSVK